jgi:hypothetical protein
MPWLGFEPTIPVFERAKTVHALDRAATVIGKYMRVTNFSFSLKHDADRYNEYVASVNYGSVPLSQSQQNK